MKAYSNSSNITIVFNSVCQNPYRSMLSNAEAESLWRSSWNYCICWVVMKASFKSSNIAIDLILNKKKNKGTAFGGFSRWYTASPLPAAVHLNYDWPCTLIKKPWFPHMLGFVLHHFSLTSSLLYSPKESSLELTVWVPLVRVAIISLFYCFWILTTLRTVVFIWWDGRMGGMGRIFISFFFW